MPIVQTITSYYYTAGTDPGSAWSSEAQVWDSTLAASSGNMGWMLCSTKGVSNTAKNLMSSVNNVSTVAGNPITKVEIGYRGQIKNANMVVYLQPIFGGSSVGSAIMIDPGTTVTQTLWTDITTVAGSPATWTRQNVADLDVNLYGYSSATTAKASTLLIDAVLIRITESSGISQSLNYVTNNTPVLNDDNFDNSSISTQWTQTTLSGASITETTELKMVNTTLTTEFAFGTNAYPQNGIRTTILSGDFEIELKIRDIEYSLVSSNMSGYYGGVGGIFISSAFNTSTATRYCGIYISPYVDDGNIYQINYFYNTTGATPIPLHSTGPDIVPSVCYLRLARTGSTINCKWSTNGSTWTSYLSVCTLSTNANILQIGNYNFAPDAASGGIVKTTVCVDYVINIPVSYNTSTVGIFPTTANMTKGLPIRAGGQQGYIRMEPTSAYAGDKGTRLRVMQGGIVYTICATTS